MKKDNKADEHCERPPHRVRLPGFVSDEDLGLGDAVTRVTSRLGMRHCDGCARRAAALNRWVMFSRRGIP